ncbi:MAG: hypothetical protein JKY23_02485 [Nitrospinaceae bacterium]|nr:hypothetical protein [Nitrospinaceae bacterium]
MIEQFWHPFTTILQKRVDSVTPVPRIKKGLDANEQLASHQFVIATF